MLLSRREKAGNVKTDFLCVMEAFLCRPQDEGVAQIKGVCSRSNLWIKGEYLLPGVLTHAFNPSTKGVNREAGSLCVPWSTTCIPIQPVVWQTNPGSYNQ